MDRKPKLPTTGVTRSKAKAPKHYGLTAVDQLRHMRNLILSMKRNSELLLELSDRVRHLVETGSVGKKPKPKFAPGAGMFGTEIPRKTLDDQLDYFNDRIFVLGSDLDFYSVVVDEALEHIARGRLSNSTQ